MKNKLILTLLLLLAGLLPLLGHYYRLSRELDRDRHSLITRIEALQTRHDTLSAHCEVLRLDRDEFQRLYHDEAERLKALRIRLRRLESLALSVTESNLRADAPLRDTVYITRHDSLVRLDTLRHFAWSDGWNRIEGLITPDTIHCHLQSTDTLRQIIHRIPRRFLFLRWGTKALRQEIHNTNPSTRIIYTDYLIIER